MHALHICKINKNDSVVPNEIFIDIDEVQYTVVVL